MSLELQGMTLCAVRKFYARMFSNNTCLLLGIQCVDILRAVHARGVLHRDIKPANFVIDADQGGRTVHILDFGLSSMYIGLNGTHLSYKERVRRCGTARYSSLN